MTEKILFDPVLLVGNRVLLSRVDIEIVGAFAIQKLVLSVNQLISADLLCKSTA